MNEKLFDFPPFSKAGGNFSESTGAPSHDEGRMNLETDQLIGRMYDLYGLEDIQDISFALLFGSSPSPPAPVKSTGVPSLLTAEEISLLRSLEDAIPEEKPKVTEHTVWTSSRPFVDPASEIPAELMYTPVQYRESNLAFPDYMMVHSESGLPVLFHDQPTTITSSMPYGGCVCYLEQGPYAESNSNMSCQSAQLGLPCPTPTGSYTAVRYDQFQSVSRVAPRGAPGGKPHPQPPRKRGRPRKQVPIAVECPPLPPPELEEKENRPCKEEPAYEMESSEENLELDPQGAGNRADDLDEDEEPSHPKPPYSYSALVTLALKNSRTGRLTVRDIYNFMCNHFPYFRTAPAGWKNSVRHNLSLNPAFLKIVGETGPARARTACRWTLNPERYRKMNDEVGKFRGKALGQILNSMRDSDLLHSLEEGTFHDFNRAIKGVCIQEKKIGQRRRKSSAKKKDGEGSEKIVSRKGKREIAALDTPSNPFSSLPLASGKTRSPLAVQSVSCNFGLPEMPKLRVSIPDGWSYYESSNSTVASENYLPERGF